MTHIDFLIIGAQKAGTTSLFEYVRRHPSIHMPAEKEIPFFATEKAFARGFDWYETRVLGGAPDSAVCGTASVSFMSGTTYRDIPLAEWNPSQLPSPEPTENAVPRRIKAVLPDAKLVCILRDPVERAFSHYKMAVLDGLESRSFDLAIEELMTPSTLDHARAVATGHNGYIARGEYGRIIKGFEESFPPEQILIVFSEDLAADPESTLSTIFGFLSVDEDFRPENLDSRYRVAAQKQRIRGLNINLLQASLAKVTIARKAWHHIPLKRRQALSRSLSLIAYRTELWNAKRGADDSTLSADARDVLISHFRADSELLSAMLGRRVPWLDAWDDVDG